MTPPKPIFKVEVYTDSKETILTLSGAIDENADFNSIRLGSTPRLVIDLKGIHHLNSLGLRNWVNWTKSLQTYPAGIVLRHCPNVAVHQMNILDGFIPLSATVESFELPYLCEECNISVLYLARRGIDYLEGNSDRAPSLKFPTHQTCPSCKGKAEPDFLPQKQFRFLSHRSADKDKSRAS